MATTILEGVAFITGAGSGIGQASAFSLAKHGVRQFALTDINASALQSTVDELIRRHGTSVEALAIEMDVSQEEAVESGVAQAVAKFGRIDFAVNSAGVTGTVGGSPDVSLEAWNKHLSINLTGVWLSQRAEIRQMLKQEPRGERYGRGSVVNVSSVHGFASSPSYIAAGAYTSAKHAVVGLTRTEATLYASKGIRINAICPGYIDTPLLTPAKAKAGLMEKLVNENTAVKRMGTAEEVGDAIMFLASPLSSFMVGSAMLVDGGYTAQ
ncbi:Short-chain dehydrogenase/reductase SDR [Lasiodiplodia theobromae]|uniref:Dihydroanticapsin 7-dehydrogenase n=2 Tax=Lasiodiplodia TaxID=66739 RepID=A0A5N5DA78_9PEZI|nr:Short-chain dehydrogenase/reductase SDR [Lasiodiplodia theobromae]KAB2574551.1 Dihydroanticapsin 7-dehydrogenase [Lasiodiplodia theobromae]KAF4537891.1 Short-chain dehydrogenase/reductase SDR [Lasiodiplodia theobromae]KAF9635591.1 Short-chain dehydrogenase/reductase SDR [Lasiodiplodia theobromae]KAK0664951.1 Dihydroanticapsin 7-dehydrogenase [Lasiodiplodia hormozganensis]